MKEDAFPSGLFQPEGSFRFSVDALLLAAFSRSFGSGERLLDLGTGCGVIALAALREKVARYALGVEVQPELARAALVNARALGFEHSFSVVCADVGAVFSGMPQNVEKPDAKGLVPAEFLPAENIEAGSFDMALANPPYRIAGQGRLPATAARTRALFGDAQTLDSFCSAASRALRNKGRFGIIFSAARAVELITCLTKNGLAPRRLMPVYGKSGKEAVFVLIEARKGLCADLKLEYPLFLYEGEGQESRLTEAALAFCPDLASNVRR